MRVSKKIVISGLVQGIGFRPFIWRIARKWGIKGWVKNSLAGVEILAEGEEENVNKFLAAIKKEKPPLAVIEKISVIPLNLSGNFETFEIIESQRDRKGVLIVPADLPVCDDCLQELRDATDRRYQYPFINCTNCGPRYTIIEKLPYDRRHTSMKKFPLCPECAKEYRNPEDRRFHAEPVACPVCGPKLYLYDKEKNLLAKDGEVIHKTKELLKKGYIVALKGLGGYHLAADPFNVEAVLLLRQRKHREAKPFALMVKNLTAAQKHVYISKAEEKLLTSNVCPIVLCRKKKSSKIVKEVSPDNDYLGIMLPYTPFHYLLLEPFEALIMTSANLSEEPIVYQDDEVFLKLKDIADFFVVNNRPILRPVDDSVAMVYKKSPVILRRARGLAPLPLKVRGMKEGILALGGQLKNSFAITKDNYVYLSQYFGDLDNLPSRLAYMKGIDDFCRFFEFTPQIVAYDLHPGYFSAELVDEKFPELKKCPIQHHKAHLAAVVAEKRIKTPFMGVIFDGTGYGEDGRIWGGEFFVAVTPENYQRIAHLKYFPLLDGDEAIKKPWKTALSLLNEVQEDVSLFIFPGVEAKEIEFAQKRLVREKIFTSSVGRLFDGISALLGLKATISYEGQAAILLETIADRSERGRYDFTISQEKIPYEIDFRPLLLDVLADLKKGVNKKVISGRFHNTIVEMIAGLGKIVNKQYGIQKVILAGGVFQNRVLLEKTFVSLKRLGLKPIIPSYIPINDQGIALGQAYLANKLCEE
ncbi:carbamoyltransferase HypF [Carboxydothermus islandicus]|uniref:Carbamoyltransferase n=1 Tax=Carboxydothermus islandicus TaxID=661089 RepID=A0A1L8D1M4_9THEO|nr:carbamoyltransferase HypF [Carboxydothermus islandicus]GAV25080.1 carbamoyltransferase HypF [Carboxydothermus islandicus]